MGYSAGNANGMLEVGEVDDIDVEGAVVASSVGDPLGDDRAEPALAHAADDDDKPACFVHGGHSPPAGGPSQTGPRMALAGPPS